MRRKLIEQCIIKYALNGESISAGSTTAHVSAAIDREGYNSMYIGLQQIGATGVNTAHYTTVHVYEEATNTGTYTILNSATDTISSVFTTSSAQTAGEFVDLTGYERYVKLYITPSAAVSNTVTVSLAAILGDAVNEPCE
jgi:hypothetical protein